MAWTSPRTWVSGEVVTAALMNTHVRDNLKAIGDAWTAYGSSTTILTAATTDPTLGTGSSATAYYMQVGKLVHFRIGVLSGTSGTAGGSGTYRFLLPVTPAATTLAPLGHGGIQAGSGGTMESLATLLWSGSGTTANLYPHGLGPVSGASYNVSTSRFYLISGTYEAA